MKKAMPVRRRGFTLIELLVVISIIGILTTLVMANLNSARERARDVERKSDLRSIQTALRLYYNDHGGYPATADLPAWGSEWVNGNTVYMSLLPADPLPDQSYQYAPDAADTDNYTLSACLENKSDDKCQTPAGISCDSDCMYQIKP